MNIERSEAVAKRYFEVEADKKDTQAFYNRVMEEFNDKCELLERVKAKVHKEKH